MASVQDIYDEITRIDNAKQGIAEAIEEKGVQVPEESRINEYPGLVRQIQTGSPDAVLYTPQELTPEQQEQARENIGAGTYTKPNTGIPKTDLETGVQTSLEKADTALQPAALTPITELIPEQATPQNQLADKNFVNSSVATNTANYISDNGQPFQSVADLEAYTGPLTNNDYAFVVGTDSAGNTTYTRYKYNATTQTWAAEYVLNNSSFTAEQWAAISSGITALLVQKLSNLPTEIVTYVVQTLTEAQKQQARTNIGATAPEVFWATYGTTTVAEIDAAVAAGKVVMCLQTYAANNSHMFLISQYDAGATYIYFNCPQNTVVYYLTLNRNTGVWGRSRIFLEDTANKVQTISGNESETTKYPSTKAVADALGKMGVVSQTQTWTGSDAAGWTYAMSDIVRGLIPQAAIDFYTRAGATFNAATGYFEMNGLQDLSYEEIKLAYAFTNNFRGQWTNFYEDEYSEIRTTFPMVAGASISQLQNWVDNMGVVAFYWTKMPNLEVIRLTRSDVTQLVMNAYSGYLLYVSRCPLREVKGILNAYQISYSGTTNGNYFLSACHQLETLKLHRLRGSVNGKNWKKLSLESVVFAVDHAANGNTAITITLHADAFARCQADTTEYTYNGQTYTGIIAYAAAKNITIQSA